MRQQGILGLKRGAWLLLMSLAASSCNEILGIEEGSLDPTDGGGNDGPGTSSSSGTGGEGGAPLTPLTAMELLQRTASCAQKVSTEKYKNEFDPAAPASIDICGLNGAYFWKAGMDIDCDGASWQSSECMGSSALTAMTDSLGKPLDSLKLEFVALPKIGRCGAGFFDYKAAGVKNDAVMAVIYNDKVLYGVFGDFGQCDAIGKASYKMAESLGILAPKGIQSGVTYIVFVGEEAFVVKPEDHAEATMKGEALARKLLIENP